MASLRCVDETHAGEGWENAGELEREVTYDGAAMAHVLFVCRQNAGRSQMSQALFERAAGGRHSAASAGTTPAERVHPEVVSVMREDGIDLEHRIPQRLTPAMAADADVAVTMGCGDECPYIPGVRYIDWDLPDPHGRSVDEVRVIRDTIEERVAALIAEFDADQSATVPQPRSSTPLHSD